jgi:protein-disulfide isomerase
MNPKKSIFLLHVILLLSPLFAQTTTAKKHASGHSPAVAAPPAENRPMLLPSQAQVDAAMKRTLGYDPKVSWEILDVRQSPIPGLADVLVSINKQSPIHIYYSTDSQMAIAGQILPFGSNPYAPTREKLASADGPSRGAKKPVIDIVEFSDLECPHCKAAQPVVEKLVEDFPQVRYTFQQFPLPASMHPWAMKAALYADCAAQSNPEGFWKFVDAIFQNQDSINQTNAEDKLKELATSSGLDAAKLAACSATLETQARVNKSLELGKTLDVNETPTVFINGRRVLGIASIPYDNLKGLVQFEIDHAGN